jgi:competence protein ComEA
VGERSSRDEERVRQRLWSVLAADTGEPVRAPGTVAGEPVAAGAGGAGVVPGGRRTDSRPASGAGGVPVGSAWADGPDWAGRPGDPTPAWLAALAAGSPVGSSGGSPVGSSGGPPVGSAAGAPVAGAYPTDLPGPDVGAVRPSFHPPAGAGGGAGRIDVASRPPAGGRGGFPRHAAEATQPRPGPASDFSDPGHPGDPGRPFPGEPALPPDDEPLADALPAPPGAGAFTSGRLSAFDPGRRGVKALAAVAVAVVLVAGFLAWRARPATEPVPTPVAVPAGTDLPVPGVAPSAAEVVVAVAGKVRKPGLIHLPPGARVADAVRAAGGAADGVDISLLNPARKVVDGELIVVGATPPPGAAPAHPGGAAPGGTAPRGAAPGPAAPAGGPVNLNTATLADLDTLPGVGPVLAQRIIDRREQRGGFRTVADLRTVDGIGDSRFEQLKDLVTV